MRTIAPSELIINEDGSVFHLHLRPGQLAPIVILVGDPARVERVSAYFDQVGLRVANREFVTVTGTYRGRPMSVVSTGIGTDNIDIVVNELDALVNIDFATRTEHPQKKVLTLLRLGTCGAIQPDLRIGDLILSDISVGFDGLLNFYKGRNEICKLDIEHAFMHEVGWGKQLAHPYFIACSRRLAALFAESTVRGMTISAPGFYAPQGRWLRLEPADAYLNDKIEQFRFQEALEGEEGLIQRRFTNFEMEGSALAGLGRMLGHEAATICTVIAQRVAQDAQTDYQPFVDKMIVMSLEKLAEI